jgi:4'-phosphopantetheinyl transferase
VGSALPRPDPDGADIVIAYCGTAGAEAIAATALSLLSEEERERAGRLRAGAGRLDYAIAHLLLLRLLQDSTGHRQPRFARGAYGKPALDPPSGAPPLRFNISHSRGCVACVMGRGAEVGIDVEDAERIGGRHHVAGEVFSAEERRVLAALDEAGRRETFAAMWTMKEAIIKADGRGLAMPLRDFTVDPGSSSARFAGDGGGSAARWLLGCHRWGRFRLAAAAVGDPPPRRISWTRVEYEALLSPGQPARRTSST